MAITYDRDDRRRRILVMITVAATIDDLLALIDRQADEQTWAYSMLYDFRASTFAPTMQEIDRLLDRVQRASRRHGARGPVALVTADLISFGVGRMYSTRSELAGLRVRVFENMTDAERWLEEQDRNGSL